MTTYRDALREATLGVIGQKSAEAIVGDPPWGAEGPNIVQGKSPMSFRDTVNPTGGVFAGRVMGPLDPNENLLERILSHKNVSAAWKQVQTNAGAPGIDGVTVDVFPDEARPLWKEIRESLFDGSYQPLPVKRVEIPKDSGGTRSLGIPIVLDRLIGQAIAQVLVTIFDAGFSESSFGFRPGRSAHGAVRQVQQYIHQGYRIAVDLDLRKFFDTVDWDILMDRVSRKVHDKRVLALIGRYLRAGCMVDGRLHATHEGVPQGSPLSPVLSNILLDDLDKELERRGHRFARYADDCAPRRRTGVYILRAAMLHRR